MVLFRIIWGFLLMAEGWGALFTGWVHRVFVEPTFTFTWYGFKWTQVLLGEFMYLPYLLLGLLGLFVMLGYRYFFASISYALIWALVFFMQKTEYNNHYYLVLLICLVMPFMPANAAFSIDFRRNTEIKSLSCPNWNVVLLPFLMFLVYFFGSMAKVYPDWLQAKPIALWFRGKGNLPILGPLLVKTWFHYFISYAGILFDLLIIPLLMIKKIRKWAFFATLFFHLFNSYIFQIGIFPYLGLSFAIFFWPAEKIGKWFLKRKSFYSPQKSTTYPIGVNWKIVLLLLFACSQIIIPLRHWFIPGDVLWTEEGHRLSWRMMLRSRSATGYFLMHKDNKVTRIRPEEFLTSNQVPMIFTHPDCLHQFVQEAGSKLNVPYDSSFRITAEVKVSINGSKYNKWIDSDVNLYGIERCRAKHNKWILPKP